MTKGDVKAWLDSIIEATENYLSVSRKMEDEGLKIADSVERRIQLYHCIVSVSDVLGVKPVRSDFNRGNYKYKYSFGYRGYEIFQISEEEIEELEEWKN